MDGANYWTLFWRIAMPLCRPALVVSFVFELKASWSDLLKPSIYLRDPLLYALPRGLKALSDQFGQSGEQHWASSRNATSSTGYPPRPEADEGHLVRQLTGLRDIP